MKIRVEDARGCWRIVGRDEIVWVESSETICLRGNSWATLRFTRTGETTPLGAEIYRAARPAIGPVGPFVASIHLPGGWVAPAAGDPIPLRRRTV